MKKIRSLPTILGLFILLVCVTAGIILISQGTKLFLRASPTITPKQIKITNINEKGFAVSWITDEPTNGFVKYGLDKELVFVARDERDETIEKSQNFLTHHIILQELKPATTYFFKIFSAGKAFDNNGQNYQVTTAPEAQDSLPKNDVAYGTVVKQDGSPAEGVIVYLTLANATPQSTLTKASGSWVIPLNVVRSNNLATYVSYDLEASIEEIFVQGGSLGTAMGVVTTKYDSPMPTIILGQSFDFRKGSQLAKDAGETSQVTPSPGQLSFEATPASTIEKELEITNPEEEENLNTQKPEFLGTGPAGETLTIELNSPTYNDQVTINPDGTWSWNPPENLTPGEHTITIALADGRSLTRSFTVLAAAGEEDLPSFSATPSATLTPTTTATPTTTPTPTPTATSTPTPTSSPTSIPSTESGVPESGILTPTFFLSLMGLAIISLGLLLVI